MDFYKIRTKKLTSNNRQADYVVYPDFTYANVKDLICKGGAVYAFWNENQWNVNVDDLIITIDNRIREKIKEIKKKNEDKIIVGRFINDNETKLMADLVAYAKLRKQSEIAFNSRIIFADETPKREDYSTNQLSFTPKKGNTEAFDELMKVLYRDEELEKIMWFMGALLTNSMPKIQKFMYLYGGKGAGKGTVIKIFKMLFDGYYSTIDLRLLTGTSEFATSQIKEVPLLIDDDTDMSKIQNDTNLLKLTAHEPISVNVKYKSAYDVIFNGLVITASNQRYQVRNIDSGITRRAVVVAPTSYTHPGETYNNLMARVAYELPMIAEKAMRLFKKRGMHFYDDYMDVEMAEATDYMFSFVRENAVALGDVVTLQKAAELFKIYLDDLGYETKGYKRRVKNELMRYYRNFYPQTKIDGVNVKNVFKGFKKDMVFPEEVEVVPDEPDLVVLDADISTFDIIAKTYPAQLTTAKETPKVKWDECTTTLSDIDTSKLHFVQLPMNHIVIDFDLKGENGEKNLERNLRASMKFPKTYMELSKSGKGVHLHYIYDGDVNALASLVEEDVEIKVFTGKQALRRKLTKHNDAPISHITTGLPNKKKKEGVSMYQDVEMIVWDEKKIRTSIIGNIEKRYHAATKPSIDFIAHILEEAEKNGVQYDVRDLRQDVYIFANKSSNNADYCRKAVAKMNFSTIQEVEEIKEVNKGTVVVPNEDIHFYDVEIFPNLFVVVWKQFGDHPKTTWYNPTSEQIEWLLQKPLIGFFNRKYDNHIMYGGLLGNSVLELYNQSQKIINGSNRDAGMYSNAYELSYADIYEYASKKQSLKKWEIELGIHHDELELAWDQPVPEELWPRVGEYCGNDVDATEATFMATYQDYQARLILAELSGLKVNATTTQHAAAFLFGDDPRPQDKFIYTDLSEMFPGYTYSFGKSEYRGEDPSEGGYVYSEPGVYEDVALLDVESEHPTSLIEMDYFGPYTQRYLDLKTTRLHIKHKDYDAARKMFNGILVPYLKDEESAEALSYALKIIINIVYGMTSAKFDNKFKHKDNVDNIVAKRGALFMIDLKHMVQEAGFTVAHIKTDSIKIPNATKEIIAKVFEFGKKYGYTFEHEATYSRIALVNNAVYIAEYGWAAKESKIGKWEAVGAQYADPIVYKKLFTGETIVEEDYAITKSATAPIYLGDTFVGKVAQVYASHTGEEMFRVAEDKKSYVAGTKNFKWRLMSDYKGKEDIDMKYYDGLVKKALENIDKVGLLGKVVDEIPQEFVDNFVKELVDGDELPF